MANSFLQYLTEKIEKIRSTSPKEEPIVVEMPKPGGKLRVFEPATEEEIREIANFFFANSLVIMVFTTMDRAGESFIGAYRTLKDMVSQGKLFYFVILAVGFGTCDATMR